MTLVTEAAVFAARAHEGQVRKGTSIPYIVHPMEAASIVAALTDEPELIAAALLHDVMEDCGVTYAQLCEQFGQRVAQIVREDSQCQSTSSGERAPWGVRKRAAVEQIASSCRDEKLIVLADKLSNMRAIFRDFEREGAAMFAKFNQNDMRQHAWYYRSCAALTKADFGHTGAWRELDWRIEHVFAGVDSVAPDGGCAQAQD